MNNSYFFQVQKITDNKIQILSDEWEDKNISFTYFEVDLKYYLFFYAKTPIFLDFIYQHVSIIQELNYKTRKIRSIRGFLLYVLETMNTKNGHNIIATNLPPLFWTKVKDVLRQNKKGIIEKFLFSSNESTSSETKLNFKVEIKNIYTQISLLQQKIAELESKAQVKTVSEFKFMPLKNIKENDLKQIVQLGFRISQLKNISLKDFYETKNMDCLFQLKGYHIKYETIRKHRFYKEFNSMK